MEQDTLTNVIIRKARESRTAWILASVVCFLFAAYSLTLVQGLKGQPKVFIVGTDQTMVFGKLEDLDPNSVVLRRIAQMAAEIALTRNPKGLQKGEYVEVLFAENARKQLDNDVKAQIPELSARNIHQHVEVRSARFHSTSKGVRAFVVHGQVILTGSLNRIPFTESRNFTMAVGLIDNTNLVTSGMWPFVVSSFRIQFTQ